MALQTLSASLRTRSLNERRASSRGDETVERRASSCGLEAVERRASSCGQESVERSASSCGPEAVVAATAPAAFVVDRLTRIEDEIVRIAKQVADLRSTLNVEAQSLRRGLATVAEAVRAMRPVLDAEVEQRAEAEARLSENLDYGLQELRAEVAEFSAIKARERLAVLERDAGECRKRVAALSDSGGADRTQQSPVPRITAATSLEEARGSSLEEACEDVLVRAQVEFAAALAEESKAIVAENLEHRRVYAEETITMGALCDRVKAESMETAEDLRRFVERETAIALSEVEVRQKAAAEVSEKAFEDCERKSVRVCEEGEERWLRAVAAEAEVCSAGHWHRDNALRGIEVALSHKVRAVAESAEVAAVCAAGAQVAKAERGLRADLSRVCAETSEAECRLRRDLAGVHTDTSESEAALSKRLRLCVDAARREADAQCVEVEAMLRTSFETAVGNASSVAQAALARAMHDIAQDTAGERLQRIAGEEGLAAAIRRSERAAASECSAQAQATERLSEVMSAGTEQRRREERGLWAKIQELSRAVWERAPVERSENLQAVERSLAEAHRALQQDLRTELRSQSHVVYEELKRSLGAGLDAHEGRAEGRAKEMHREFRRREREEERSTASLLERRCEAAARSLGSEMEERCVVLQHRISSDSRHGLEEVRDELHAFMDEQRVFCGFLDTEQKSYHELMRQEVGALSRLVDSALPCDSLTSPLEEDDLLRVPKSRALMRSIRTT